MQPARTRIEHAWDSLPVGSLEIHASINHRSAADMRAWSVSIDGHTPALFDVGGRHWRFTPVEAAFKELATLTAGHFSRPLQRSRESDKMRVRLVLSNTTKETPMNKNLRFILPATLALVTG